MLASPTSPRLRRRLIPAIAAAAVALAAAGVALSTGTRAHTHGRTRRLAPVSVSPPPATTARPPVAASLAGKLLRIHFYSRALGRVADYLVYLPREYTGRTRLPVFYMLHGMPGRPLAFTVDANIEPKLERLIRLHRIKPMILVFPDGRINGDTHTDSEWANTPSGRFESYVVDVVHDVDHRFATLPSRHDRAIAGLSAGAYGALNVGLHHLRLFSVIQAWSGYYLETHNGVFADASPAVMAYNSPADYVWRLRSTIKRFPLLAFLYIGTDDEGRAETPPMAVALRDVGADASYAMYPGGHSWKLWSPRVDQMLLMADRHFARPVGQARR